MKVGTSVKIEKTSKVILFWTVAFIAALTAISYFATWNTIQYIAPALVFGIALFVFVEVGYFEGFKRKDVWRIAGSLIAIAAVIGVATELIPQIPEIGVLNTFKGALSALLAIFFVVEGLR